MNSIYNWSNAAHALTFASLLAAACGGNQTSYPASDSGVSGGNGGAAGATGGRNNAGGIATAGSSTHVGGAGSTGGAPATGGISSTGGSVATDCNSLVNTAPVEPLTAVALDPPTPMGGSIADGTYYLTQYQEYTGPGGSTTPDVPATVQYMLVVSASTSSSVSYQLIATVSLAGTTVNEETNGTFTISGTNLTAHFTCNTMTGGNGSTTAYTATADQLTFFTPLSTSLTGVSVLTRQ